MTPSQPYMWHWEGMWVFPLIMFVVMIVFLFLFVRRGGCRPPWWGPRGYHGEEGNMGSALEILKTRYAKGEITKEEFEQIKKDILS